MSGVETQLLRGDILRGNEDRGLNDSLAQGSEASWGRTDRQEADVAVRIDPALLEQEAHHGILLGAHGRKTDLFAL
jgi:hypothetical protein